MTTVLEAKKSLPSNFIFTCFSQIWPLLENFDFQVISERPSKIRLSEDNLIWVQEFTIETYAKPNCDPDTLENFLIGFKKAWRNSIFNDGFNRLIVRAGLTWRPRLCGHFLSKYLWQLRVNFTQQVMEAALLNHGEIVRHMIQLFCIRFDPQFTGDRSERAI